MFFSDTATESVWSAREFAGGFIDCLLEAKTFSSRADFDNFKVRFQHPMCRGGRNWKAVFYAVLKFAC